MARRPRDDDEDHAPTRRRRGPRRRGRGLIGRLVYWGAVLGVWAFIAVAGIVAFHASRLPPIHELTVPRRPPNIAIVSADGTLLANRGETGGSAVPIAELPKYLPQAFVAIEDRRFYGHFGIDPIGLVRAAATNITGRSMQGGSTLTQQLAKNLFLTQERTFSRKVQEAILALWLERTYSKDQILELYLNRVYFGSGAFGVEAASQKYFGKSARAVTVAEAATLAGLVQAPSRLAPNRNPSGAAERAAQVIAAMVREKYVTEKVASVALSAPAKAKRQGGAGSVNYAADWVMDVLGDFIGTIDGDIVVRTTLDPALQAAAERALVETLDAKGAKSNVGQGAVVSLDPDGSVRALVGGRSYADSQFDRAVAARRQPGSSFKPFVYLTALEQGMTPETVLLDAPINIKGWQPENYTREYFGNITMAKALAMSLNTPVIRVAQEVGPKAVVRTAQRLGIASALQANASIALGTSEVTPLEMASAYASFANGGVGVVPHIITEVKGADGKLIYQRKPAGPGRVIEPETLAQLDGMLRETLVSGTGRKADIPGWEAAGKTGTTQDYKDAWFMGFTAHLVTAVWLGNDDGDPMKKVTGSGLPVEVWNRFMRDAHKGVPPVALPGLPRQASPFDGVLGNGPLAQNAPARGTQPPNVMQDERAVLTPPQPASGPGGRDRNLLQRLIGG